MFFTKTPPAGILATTFHVFLIKPSHYDDDGYVIQWARSDVPSNTLAVLNGLALDCRERRVLGDDVDIDITPIDEFVTRVVPQEILQTIRRSRGKGMVALVGVQTNQYPRAIDLARHFRDADIPVCIGGFHTSGVLAMISELPNEIREALDMGVSIFAGEAEGHFEELLKDAYRNDLKPLYNYLSDLRGLESAPLPVMPGGSHRRTISPKVSFETGRGCPFQCTFCCIINVQGRRSRYRSSDKIEEILRTNYSKGVDVCFICDDNFARNKNWKSILERIITLREKEGIEFTILLQVDVLSHLIPGFIESARRAGVRYVFIGLESVNPQNLLSVNKKQNRLVEYRNTILAWKKIGAITIGGYMIGFAHDTPEGVLEDVETIKRDLPIDVIGFTCLSPVPGSEDHKVHYEKRLWMEPDLNKYDGEHVCCRHPLMSQGEFTLAYRNAWDAYYTPGHIETIMRRAAACGMNTRNVLQMCLWFAGCQKIEHVHPFQGGLFRRKHRLDRRSIFPTESRAVFYARYGWEIVSKHARLALLVLRYVRIWRQVEKDPSKLDYRDSSLMDLGQSYGAPSAPSPRSAGAA